MARSLTQWLCDSVGFFGVQACLQTIATAIEQPLAVLTPSEPASKHHVAVRDLGLELFLSHPHAGLTENGAPDRWVLSAVHLYRTDPEKGAWPYQLPHGLHWSMDALATQAALGDEICTGRHTQAGMQTLRQSHFLPTAQVVQCTWLAHATNAPKAWDMRVIEVYHLGSARPWDERDWIDSSPEP